MKKTLIEKFNKVLELIDEYNQIVLLRHISPDADALGSQFGLASWIKANYKNKKVFCKGINSMNNGVFPCFDNEKVIGKYLTIVLDTPIVARCECEEYIDKASYVIKIDHHDTSEKFANIEIVDSKAIATCYMISSFLLKLKDKTMPADSCKYFYAGIISDSGSFKYRNTTSDTLLVASKLIKKGKIDVASLSQKIFDISSKEDFYCRIEYEKRVKFKDKIAYVVLNQNDIDEIGSTYDVLKDYIFLISGFSDIEASLSFVYDKKDNRYRVGMRSKNIKINRIAVKHSGGGHLLAAGAYAKDENEINTIIKEVGKAIEKLG